jgi:predicted RNA-binding protein with PIN domain
MYYYIDGYNLLFRFYDVDTSDFQSRREELIDDLTENLLSRNIQGTIVFDSMYKEGGSSRSHRGDIEIIYTAFGETADDKLTKILSETDVPRQTILITSDKLLAWRARRLGVRTESADQFMQWIRKPIGKKNKKKSAPKKTEPKVPKSAAKEETSDDSSCEEQDPFPATDATFNQSYGYYLNVFEKRYKDIRKGGKKHGWKKKK